MAALVVCPVHVSVPMKPEHQKTPRKILNFGQIQYERDRVIWRCPVAGCHRVKSGKDGS